MKFSIRRKKRKWPLKFYKGVSKYSIAATCPKHNVLVEVQVQKLYYGATCEVVTKLVLLIVKINKAGYLCSYIHPPK